MFVAVMFVAVMFVAVMFVTFLSERRWPHCTFVKFHLHYRYKIPFLNVKLKKINFLCNNNFIVTLLLIFVVTLYSKDYTNSDYTVYTQRVAKTMFSTIMVIRIELRIFHQIVTSARFLAQKKENDETLKTIVCKNELFFFGKLPPDGFFFINKL